MRVMRWIDEKGQWWHRKEFEDRFEGSRALFEHCWKRWREYVNGTGECTTSAEDVMKFLNDRASEAVNDTRSPYYLYG